MSAAVFNFSHDKNYSVFPNASIVSIITFFCRISSCFHRESYIVYGFECGIFGADGDRLDAVGENTGRNGRYTGGDLHRRCRVIQELHDRAVLYDKQVCNDHIFGANAVRIRSPAFAECLDLIFSNDDDGVGADHVPADRGGRHTIHIDDVAGAERAVGNARDGCGDRNAIEIAAKHERRAADGLNAFADGLSILL